MGALRSIAARSFGSAKRSRRLCRHLGRKRETAGMGSLAQRRPRLYTGRTRSCRPRPVAPILFSATRRSHWSVATGAADSFRAMADALSEALRIAAEAWLPADASGTLSFLNPDRAVVEDAAERPLGFPLRHVPHQTADNQRHAGDWQVANPPEKPAAYLVMRAAATLDSDNPAAMRRCACCSFWFETRRVNNSLLTFLLGACRALSHQNRRTRWRRSARASREGTTRWQSGVATAGAGRKDATTDKKLRKPKGGARPRAASRAGSRTPRRRRPAKT